MGFCWCSWVSVGVIIGVYGRVFASESTDSTQLALHAGPRAEPVQAPHVMSVSTKIRHGRLVTISMVRWRSPNTVFGGEAESIASIVPFLDVWKMFQLT